MKRSGSMFDRVHAFENLLLAAARARRGKRYRPEVLRFEAELPQQLARLERELAGRTWMPGRLRHFQIYEPKKRWISAAPYPDRVVHHALCRQIEPEIDRRLIADCWANRKGLGSHRAVLRYQRFASQFRFCLKCDIAKYFPSIDHEILKGQFRRVFKESALLQLMDRIVDSAEVPEPSHHYFPGDDLFTPHERRQGLPIGNLTSQIWANLYLNEFDHWIKRGLGCHAYLRFVDDFVLLHNDKATLKRWREQIATRLEDLRLKLQPRKCVVRRTDEGVAFLGYVVRPDRVRVRGETVRRMRRRIRGRAASTGDSPDVRQALMGWLGHTDLAGTWRQTSRLHRVHNAGSRSATG